MPAVTRSTIDRFATTAPDASGTAKVNAFEPRPGLKLTAALQHAYQEALTELRNNGIELSADDGAMRHALRVRVKAGGTVQEVEVGLTDQPEAPEISNDTLKAISTAIEKNYINPRTGDSSNDLLVLGVALVDRIHEFRKNSLEPCGYNASTGINVASGQNTFLYTFTEKTQDSFGLRLTAALDSKDIKSARSFGADIESTNSYEALRQLGQSPMSLWSAPERLTGAKILNINNEPFLVHSLSGKPDGAAAEPSNELLRSWEDAELKRNLLDCYDQSNLKVEVIPSKNPGIENCVVRITQQFESPRTVGDETVEGVSYQFTFGKADLTGRRGAMEVIPELLKARETIEKLKLLSNSVEGGAAALSVSDSKKAMSEFLEALATCPVHSMAEYSPIGIRYQEAQEAGLFSTPTVEHGFEQPSVANPWAGINPDDLGDDVFNHFADPNTSGFGADNNDGPEVQDLDSEGHQKVDPFAGFSFGSSDPNSASSVEFSNLPKTEIEPGEEDLTTGATPTSDPFLLSSLPIADVDELEDPLIPEPNTPQESEDPTADISALEFESSSEPEEAVELETQLSDEDILELTRQQTIDDLTKFQKFCEQCGQILGQLNGLITDGKKAVSQSVLDSVAPLVEFFTDYTERIGETVSILKYRYSGIPLADRQTDLTEVNSKLNSIKEESQEELTKLLDALSGDLSAATKNKFSFKRLFGLQKKTNIVCPTLDLADVESLNVQLENFPSALLLFAREWVNKVHQNAGPAKADPVSVEQVKSKEEPPVEAVADEKTAAKAAATEAPPEQQEVAQVAANSSIVELETGPTELDLLELQKNGLSLRGQKYHQFLIDSYSTLNNELITAVAEQGKVLSAEVGASLDRLLTEIREQAQYFRTYGNMLDAVHISEQDLESAEQKLDRYDQMLESMGHELSEQLNPLLDLISAELSTKLVTSMMAPHFGAQDADGDSLSLEQYSQRLAKCCKFYRESVALESVVSPETLGAEPIATEPEVLPIVAELPTAEILPGPEVIFATETVESAGPELPLLTEVETTAALPPSTSLVEADESVALHNLSLQSEPTRQDELLEFCDELSAVFERVFGSANTTDFQLPLDFPMSVALWKNEVALNIKAFQDISLDSAASPDQVEQASKELFDSIRDLLAATKGSIDVWLPEGEALAGRPQVPIVSAEFNASELKLLVSQIESYIVNDLLEAQKIFRENKARSEVAIQRNELLAKVENLREFASEIKSVLSEEFTEQYRLKNERGFYGHDLKTYLDNFEFVLDAVARDMQLAQTSKQKFDFDQRQAQFQGDLNYVTRGFANFLNQIEGAYSIACNDLVIWLPSHQNNFATNTQDAAAELRARMQQVKQILDQASLKTELSTGINLNFVAPALANNLVVETEQPAPLLFEGEAVEDGRVTQSDFIGTEFEVDPSAVPTALPSLESFDDAELDVIMTQALITKGVQYKSFASELYTVLKGAFPEGSHSLIIQNCQQPAVLRVALKSALDSAKNVAATILDFETKLAPPTADNEGALELLNRSKGELGLSVNSLINVLRAEFSARGLEPQNLPGDFDFTQFDEQEFSDFCPSLESFLKDDFVASFAESKTVAVSEASASHADQLTQDDLVATLQGRYEAYCTLVNDLNLRIPDLVQDLESKAVFDKSSYNSDFKLAFKLLTSTLRDVEQSLVSVMGHDFAPQGSCEVFSGTLGSVAAQLSLNLNSVLEYANGDLTLKKYQAMFEIGRLDIAAMNADDLLALPSLLESFIRLDLGKCLTGEALSRNK
jgi:hypothetical protein